MKTSFDFIVAKLLKAEGLFSDHPSDPGSVTMRGITMASWAAYLGREVTRDEMKELSKEDAIKFYKSEYWDRRRVEEFEPELRHIWFDMSVNHGSKNAGKILQQSVNTKQGSDALDVDGLIGPNTMGRIGILELRDILVERFMFFANNAFRGSRYAERTSSNDFIRGWSFHRIFSFLTDPLEERIAELEAENKELKAQLLTQ